MLSISEPRKFFLFIDHLSVCSLDPLLRLDSRSWWGSLLLARDFIARIAPDTIQWRSPRNLNTEGLGQGNPCSRTNLCDKWPFMTRVDQKRRSPSPRLSPRRTTNKIRNVYLNTCSSSDYILPNRSSEHAEYLTPRPTMFRKAAELHPEVGDLSDKPRNKQVTKKFISVQVTFRIRSCCNRSRCPFNSYDIVLPEDEIVEYTGK